MTTFQQLDHALRAKGWRYDMHNQEFVDEAGKVIRAYRKVLAIVPGMTLNELASYQDDKWVHSPKAQKVQAAYREMAKRWAARA